MSLGRLVRAVSAPYLLGVGHSHLAPGKDEQSSTTTPRAGDGGPPHQHADDGLGAVAAHRCVARRQDAGLRRGAERRAPLRRPPQRRQRRHPLAARLRLQGRAAARRQPADHGSQRASYDSTWTQPWGEVARVRDHHNELRVDVAETKAPARQFSVVFRVFDDGLGFRYELPDQPAITDYEISRRAHRVHARRQRQRLVDRVESPAARPLGAALLRGSPVSTLDSVQTPLTIKFRAASTSVIHEANLVDYPRMFLAGPRMESRTLRAALAPWADGVKVRGRTPLVTPWRTIQLADRVEDLQPQLLTLNLNPPSKLVDVSWIVPQKYVGIWWGMHLNTMTWSSGPSTARRRRTRGSTSTSPRRTALRACSSRGGTSAGTATGSRTRTPSRSRSRTRTTISRRSPPTRSRRASG